MNNTEYLQDLIAPNLANYKGGLEKSANHIFKAFVEYFDIDHYAKSLGNCSINEGVFVIELPDLLVNIIAQRKMVIDSNFMPECVISFYFDDTLDEESLLQVKISRDGLVSFSSEHNIFDSMTFDYNASYLPAMILSRCLRTLMEKNIINL